MSMFDPFDFELEDGVKICIDLGTTNSLAACCKPSGVPVVLHLDGVGCESGMPMVFYRDKNGQEFAGDLALKENCMEDPEGVCTSVKMKLEGGPIVLHGHAYQPREIMKKLLARLLVLVKEAMETDYMEYDPKHIEVAGVPESSTAKWRGEMQTIHNEVHGVKVRLVGEATLAAVNAGSRMSADHPFLVVDSGGGTTDVVVLIPTGNPDEPFEAQSPRSIQVAGDQLDAIMVEYILEQIRDNPGSLNMQLMENAGQVPRRRLPQLARMAKEKLSVMDSYSLDVSDYQDGCTRVELRKEAYEKRIAPVIHRIADLAEEVLKSSSLGNQPQLNVLMVGGTSHVPLLRKVLQERFFWLKDSSFLSRMPEKAVVSGAAIFASRPQVVTPRVSYGYAVETHVDRKHKKLNIIIPADSQMPVFTNTCYTPLNDNQTVIGFTIYETKERGAANTLLELNQGVVTEYVVEHKFNRAVSKETQVTLNAHLNESGMLTITVTDELGNPPTMKRFHLRNLSGDSQDMGVIDYEEAKKILSESFGVA